MPVAPSNAQPGFDARLAFALRFAEEDRVHLDWAILHRSQREQAMEAVCAALARVNDQVLNELLYYEGVDLVFHMDRKPERLPHAQADHGARRLRFDASRFFFLNDGVLSIDHMELDKLSRHESLHWPDKPQTQKDSFASDYLFSSRDGQYELTQSLQGFLFSITTLIREGNFEKEMEALRKSAESIPYLRPHLESIEAHNRDFIAQYGNFHETWATFSGGRSIAVLDVMTADFQQNLIPRVEKAGGVKEFIPNAEHAAVLLAYHVKQGEFPSDAEYAFARQCLDFLMRGYSASLYQPFQIETLEQWKISQANYEHNGPSACKLPAEILPLHDDGRLFR